MNESFVSLKNIYDKALKYKTNRIIKNFIKRIIKLIEGKNGQIYLLKRIYYHINDLTIFNKEIKLLNDFNRIVLRCFINHHENFLVIECKELLLLVDKYLLIYYELIQFKN